MVKSNQNAVIWYGGGPTAVINETAVGAIEVLSRSEEIDSILIGMHGMNAVKTKRFFNARRESAESLERIAKNPGAAAGTSRIKPSKEPEIIEQAFELFRRNNIHYLICIGGDDTALAAGQINQVAQDKNYPLVCVHAPKTIDNDVVGNHHTPGYASAALYAAATTHGIGRELESMPTIMINVAMGRHAGFLPASTALAKQSEKDAPHLIYIPERPVKNVEEIINDIKAINDNLGYCCVTVSEGAVVATDEGNQPLLSELMGYLRPRGVELNIDPDIQDDLFKIDGFGHPELSAYSFLGDFLAMALRLDPDLKKARIRAQTWGYTQRSIFLSREPRDVTEARMVGREAAAFALSGDVDGSITLQRCPQKKYGSYTEPVPISKIAGKTRYMPDEFIGGDGKSVTPKFLQYAGELITTPIPETERFSHLVLLK